MRRRWIGRGLWIVGFLGLAAVGIYGNSLVQPPAPTVYHSHAALDVPGYSSNGTLEHPSHADVAQVDKALSTRAHAVLDGDRAAFLSVRRRQHDGRVVVDRPEQPPAWLAEGSAEYVGWHASGGLASAARYRGYLAARPLPDRLPISADFYLDHVQANYLRGMALVTWIEEHRGSDAVLALMRAYTDAGAGNASYDPDVASDHILRAVLKMSGASLAHAAYAELNATVRSSSPG